MSFAHVELLVPSAISLLLALYPLPWHLRLRTNIATLSMIFWMTALNIIHTVNCIIWSDNTKLRSQAWGDISSALAVGYNFGLPISHLILAKQLEAFTSLRADSPLYDQASERRHRIFDLSVAIGGPSLGILLHLSMMDRRFFVVESYGPMAATLWDAWGVVGMAIVPILIAAACAVYTIMALVNIHLRRRQLRSMIMSDESVNKEQFVRLMFLTIAELSTCILRAIFNLMSFQHGPQPIGLGDAPRRNLTIIEQVRLDQVSPTGKAVLYLQFYTVVACSVIFFACFATSTETKQFYWSVLYRAFPCLPSRDPVRTTRLGSIDNSVSTGSGTPHTPRSAASTDLLRSTSPYSPDPPYTPYTPRDVSLQDMLSAPAVRPETDAGWRAQRGYSEDVADRVFLAPYPDPRDATDSLLPGDVAELDKDVGNSA